MTADAIATAREELRRGIAATIRLWAEVRANPLDAVLAREHGTSGDAKSFGSHAGLMDNPW